MTLKTSHYRLLAVLFCIPLFFLNVTELHSWGDDFSQYMKEAQNLAEGKPFYQSAYIFNSQNTEYAPPQYPPGYPLLMAPVVKMFGLQIKPLLYLNSVLFSALLISLFGYFRKHTGALAALLLSLMIVYSHMMLDMKGNILSDAPCLLFVTIYLCLRNTERFTWQRLLLLIGTGTFVILIRSQGLILLAAEGLYFAVVLVKQLRQKKAKFRELITHPSLIIGCGVFVLFLVLNKTIFATPADTLSFYKGLAANTDRTWWWVIGDNANYTLTLFLEFFKFKVHDQFWQAPVTLIGYTILVFSLLGLIQAIRCKFTVETAFILLMYLFILVFPEHQGPRFLLEALPIYLLYAFVAMRRALPVLVRLKPRAILLTGSIFYFIMGYDTYRSYADNQCAYCMPSARDSALFRYLQTQVPDTDIIVCNHPRAFALFTNRRCMVYAWQKTAEENKAHFDSLGVRYILTGFDYAHHLDGFLKTTQCALDTQHIIDDFLLIRIRE